MLTGNIFGQLKTYLVLEAGPSWDISRAQDPGNMFKQAQMYGSVGGASLWQEIAGNLSIGTGIYYHNYLSGINPVDNRPNQPGFKSYSAILIPARISYSIRQSDFPFSITPRLGYQYGIVLDAPSTWNTSNIITNMDGVTMAYDIRENATTIERLHLIEAGISADYRFSNNWQLSLSFSSFSGLREIKSTEIAYTQSGGSNFNTTYSNDGSRFQTTFGVQAPLSNLWEKKDYRLHKKIENAYGRGSSTRKYRYIYFGGDLGALWRSFSTVNPAIGPRPIDGKGIFRYSNLHTGALLGYKLSSYTSLDAGIYYQRSSTFFTVMYDHESDFIERTRAPAFLDIPVMFRYYYDLYNSEFSIVPALGLSVLTHFSGPGYGTGDGTFEYADLSGTSTATVSYIAGRTVRVGFAVRAGIGLEYELPIKQPLIASANVSYSHGLRRIDEITVNTQIPGTTTLSSVDYNGTGWIASIGVRMPFLLGKENRKCGAMPRIR